jgi:hypothetical protein
VGIGRGVLEAAVHEPEVGGAVGLGREVDLHRRRAWRDPDLGALPPVGEHQPVRPDHLDVPARAAVAVWVGPAHNAARHRVERGVLGHPQHEQLGVDEQVEELLDRCADHQLLRSEPHGF